MSQPSLSLRLAAAGLLVIGAPAGLAAAPPGGHVVITEVVVDSGASTLEITGADFDFGQDLTVTLGEIGDVTSFCTADFTPPQTILCDFSGTGLPPAGDYLLTVSTGPGQSKNAEYDLTLGAAGPAGPPGPAGVLGFYTVSAVAVAAGGGVVETITAEALCGAGDAVVGGGFTHALEEGGHSMPQDVTSAPNGAGTGWVGLIQRIMPAGSSLTVWARCADLTP